ncbi:hypothetical protein Ppa06_43500 [Planomonospora parontospora subsp. parontospora]|uniref:Uncharacterized protein n=2 Tax=Planomonospora parontospora TaxID=58119 RepID=A0AA37BKY3_9ACTN|nr:hypothetical protein [Planomonospora parontospora]GGK84235.1 hypothetical protein GCM10010126_49350 [Planomonospora parontospora]GII10552.1 hypothetical protein Ppa06_43500 [Planomonospora parontospora subsp. parontospora]
MNDFNRRLLKRGVGSDDWEEFPGRSVAHGFAGPDRGGRGAAVGRVPGRFRQGTRRT